MVNIKFISFCLIPIFVLNLPYIIMNYKNLQYYSLMT